MIIMYIAYCEIKAYDGSDTFFEECALLYATSFTDAAKQLEAYYGLDLEECSIKLYDMGIFHFSNDQTKAIQNILEEGCV